MFFCYWFSFRTKWNTPFKLSNTYRRRSASSKAWAVTDLVLLREQKFPIWHWTRSLSSTINLLFLLLFSPKVYLPFQIKPSLRLPTFLLGAWPSDSAGTVWMQIGNSHLLLQSHVRLRGVVLKLSRASGPPTELVKTQFTGCASEIPDSELEWRLSSSVS